MEDIAQVYSRALFEAAQEHGKLDEVREQLAELSDAIAESRDLQVFLFSPYFSTEEKEEGFKRAVTDVDPLLQNFLDVLLENHRLPAIHRIRRQFDALWAEEKRLLPVEVTSAVELGDDEVRSLGERIGEQAGREVQLTANVDPDILGGIVLRVGNSVMDASIRNRLNQLRRQVARG